MFQENVTGVIRAFTVYGLLICLLAGAAISQVNEPNDLFVCKDVETKVSSEITVSKVQRRVSYSDECRLYFYSGKQWVSISIKRFKTQKKSKEDFSDSFDFITFNGTYPEKVRILRRNNFWSEAKAYTNISDSDHLIMLRHKWVVVTLISSDYELIERVESVLRTMQFGN